MRTCSPAGGTTWPGPVGDGGVSQQTSPSRPSPVPAACAPWAGPSPGPDLLTWRRASCGGRKGLLSRPGYFGGSWDTSCQDVWVPNSGEDSSRRSWEVSLPLMRIQLSCFRGCLQNGSRAGSWGKSPQNEEPPVLTGCTCVSCVLTPCVRVAAVRAAEVSLLSPTAEPRK